MEFNYGEITQKKQLTHDILEFVIRPEKPVSYLAGQYIMLTVPQEQKKSFRAYSIACHPGDQQAGIIRFIIKILSQGAASEFLQIKEVGDKLEFRGPLGQFTFKSADDRNIIAVATGTGLAPLLSIIEDQLDLGNQSQFLLIWGNRYDADIFWLDHLDELMEKYANFKYEMILSKPDQSWQGRRGYVGDILNEFSLEDENIDYYLCGLPQMVEDVSRLLETKGVPKNQIFHEKYVSVGKALHKE